MTFAQLLRQSVLFHWRGNLAVLLGVAVGSAVLTGALLVGDCLRGSLKALALDQLGWVDQALVAGRFFRAALADDLPADHVAPAVLLQGSASKELSGKKAKTVGKVTILGVDRRFWSDGSVPQSWGSANANVVLNTTLASALQVKVGDTINLNVQKPDGIPRETLLGKRKADDVLQALTVIVREIRPDQGLAHFTLKPSPEPVRNAFVPLAFLQEKLGLAGRANAILASASNNGLQTLATKLTLDDWGLRLRTPKDRARAFVRYLDPANRGRPLKKFRWEGRVPDELAKRADTKGDLSIEEVIAFYRMRRGYLSLESWQLFLEEEAVRALEKMQSALPPSYASGTGHKPAPMIAVSAPRSTVLLPVAPALVYLADTVSMGKQDFPYVVVAATDIWGPPGAFVVDPMRELKDDEIMLAAWQEVDPHVKPGAKIGLIYYAPDELGQLHKKSATFVLKTILPLDGPLDDPDLTPEFPGVTDKLNMRSWEDPPFPFDKKRIKPTDDEYWKRHRATPRAYVSLKTGQRLWGSRFGQLTSIRIALPQGTDTENLAKRVEQGLLSALNPQQGGFIFQDVKNQALRASGGAIDFSEYFLYFSGFLIIASLLLVGLLFRLNLDRRASEVGLLLALGWRQGQVRRLLLLEGLVLAVAGAALGLLAAGVYARAMLDFLSERWKGGEGLSFLGYHPQPSSFGIGFVAAVLVSLFTIFWAVRALARIPPKSLLSGETIAAAHGGDNRPRWSVWVMLIFALGAIGCLAGAFVATSHGVRTFSFFGSGTCLLIALLAATWAWMRRGKQATVVGGPNALLRLGIRNAARHPVRSLLTIGLLGSAMFLVVSVQSFHREVDEAFHDHNGGSGGFDLIMESDVPIFQDLNRPEARRDLYASRKPPTVLDEARFYPFRVRPGDDASCLNLYQPLRPRLLGVPAELSRRGGFHFAATLNPDGDEKTNPWRTLDRHDDDDAIPVFADANAATYILHVELGDIIEVPDERGQKQKLRIAGLLQESIFQGELLMSDANFKKMFPRQEGFNYFLVEAAVNRVDETLSALEMMPGLPGLYVTLTFDRLKGFLDVENTYLLTFQVLGGFGLLLGALGLAVVLLRSVWERRGELALLRALGFRRWTLGWFVLAENGYLLLLGLGVGTLSALVSVLPFLLGSGSRILWGQLALLLALVMAVGLGSATLAVAATLRAPLLSALRRE